jgi:hypothetical protein
MTTQSSSAARSPSRMRDAGYVFANDFNFRSYGTMESNRAEDYPGLTPEALVDWYRSMHADKLAWVMAKLQSGHALFPSAVLPPMERLSPDFYRRWCELSRDAGMYVCAYTCGGDDEHAFQQHPEWFQEYGRAYACLSSPFWDREFEAVREMLRVFPADGLFYDMVRFSGNCTCEFCRAAYLKLYGLPMPERHDTRRIQAERWNWRDERRDTMRFRLDTFRQWVTRATRAGRDIVPGIEVSVNHQWYRQDGVPGELLPHFDWNFCEFGHTEWTGEILRAQGGGDKPLLCGTFPFDPRTCAHLLGRRIQPLSGDVLLDFRTGKLVSAEDRRVRFNRHMLDELRDCDPYVKHATAIPHAAVLFSDSGHSYFSLSRPGDEGVYSQIVATWVREATRMGLTCCAVEVAERLTRAALDRYEVVFAPDLGCLDENLAALLRGWVGRGGILFASGVFALLDARGEIGQDYVDGGLLGVKKVDGPLDVFCVLDSYEHNGETREIPDLVAINDPILCAPTTALAVARGSVGADGDTPLIWQNRVGNGVVIYLAGRPREGGYSEGGQPEKHVNAMRGCVQALLLPHVSRAPFRTSIEYPSEVWLNEQTREQRLVMHVVAFEKPLVGQYVSIRADLTAGDLMRIVYPASKDAVIHGDRERGYVRFALPEMHGHVIMLLERS